MAINLSKNDSINLSKEVPSVTKFRAGLGWTPGVNFNFDLDVSVFGLTSVSGAPKLLSEDWFIYFNNKESQANALVHTGDNLTGEGAGDDETILVDLSLIPVEIDEISFIITIYDAVGRSQHFGDVKDAYINIYDNTTPNGAVIAQYNLTESFNVETAVQFGSFVRVNNDWAFQAVGAGYVKDLRDIVNSYS